MPVPEWHESIAWHIVQGGSSYCDMMIPSPSKFGRLRKKMSQLAHCARFSRVSQYDDPPSTMCHAMLSCHSGTALHGSSRERKPSDIFLCQALRMPTATRPREGSGWQKTETVCNWYAPFDGGKAPSHLTKLGKWQKKS